MRLSRCSLRKVSSAMLLLAVLAAAAASVNARPSRQLLHKKHFKKQSLPLALHMDSHIPAAALSNPSNPPMMLANPSQPPLLLPRPAVDTKPSKQHHKKHHEKHAKFDKHDEDLMQLLPPLALPNPSQPPLPLPAAPIKLSKHDKKALKMQMKLDAKLAKFDHAELPAVFNQQPASMPNPSQPPQSVPLPAAAVDVKAHKLSKHERKALKAAAKLTRLAKAAGVDIDQVAGVSVADVVMRNEPRFQGPAVLG